jgi:hypothetical protein
MYPHPLVRLFSLVWLAALAVAWVPSAHAASDNAPNPPAVSLGDDTYALTRRTTFFYFRGTAKLAKRARADAEKFCHDMGKEMKELSMDEQKGGLVIGDFSKATITFKALAPGDPALTETQASATTAAVPAGSGDLTKLEELHRGGVLADPEFDAAKKRLAERSLEELHNKGVLSDSEFEAARKRLSER